MLHCKAQSSAWHTVNQKYCHPSLSFLSLSPLPKTQASPPPQPPFTSNSYFNQCLLGTKAVKPCTTPRRQFYFPLKSYGWSQRSNGLLRGDLESQSPYAASVGKGFPGFNNEVSTHTFLSWGLSVFVQKSRMDFMKYL